jgi:hypothetical protein
MMDPYSYQNSFSLGKIISVCAHTHVHTYIYNGPSWQDHCYFSFRYADNDKKIFERKIIGCICEREMLVVQPWCICTRIEWESDGSLLLAGRNLISLMMMGACVWTEWECE